jgi:hypothetical protein
MQSDIYKIACDFKNKFPEGDGWGISRTIYRGESNAAWSLTPSISRPGQNRREVDIVQEALDSAPIGYDNLPLFDYIARLQHDNQPTRFIDYSTNLDVALFFACSSESNLDGRLYISTYPNCRKTSWASTAIISRLSLIKERIRVRDFAREIYRKYPEMLQKQKNHYDLQYYSGIDLDALALDDLVADIVSFCDHGFAVVPSEDEYKALAAYNQKIVKQSGCFFVCGNLLEKADGSIDDSRLKTSLYNGFIGCKLAPVSKNWLDSCLTHEVIIPSDMKQEIQEHLASKGITKNYLFPN